MAQQQFPRVKRNDQKISFPPVLQEALSGGWETWVKPSEATYAGRSVLHYSEGHPKSRNGKRYAGGPFYVSHVKPDVQIRNVTIDVTTTRRRKYVGPIVMPVDLSNMESLYVSPDSKSTMNQKGSEAITIVDPTNPNAQLGVALGEIVADRRLSLPAISAWKRRTEIAKAAGSEYLAAQFGWLPFVSDMKDTAQSIRDGNKIMENYQAASGSLVHREFAFDDIVSRDEKIIGTGRCQYSSSGSVSSFHTGNVPIIQKTKTTTSRWFSGSFTYHYGDGSSLGKCLGVNSEIDKLFGLSLTPDLIWELTPWSWAIDWFSNAGGVISNATSMKLAGLVMKYGYIMTERVTDVEYFMPSTGLACGGTAPPAKAQIVTKQREVANPFGFGVSWEGLSPTQLAITAALGITRLR